MWPVFPISSILILAAFICTLVVLAVRIVQPEWWQSRIARSLIFAAVAAILIGVGIWSTGSALGHITMIRTGAALAYMGTLIALPAAIVMPAAALLDRVLIRATKATTTPPTAQIETTTNPPVLLEASRHLEEKTVELRQTLSQARTKLTRRAIIRYSAMSLPTIAAARSASGFVEAGRPPTIPIVRVRYPNLHPDLHGLKILQLSDLHLGSCKDPKDLERALEVARAAHRPDLIVVTGDLADFPPMITDALKLVHDQQARYGALACLGNHEYLNDIDITLPLYEASPVPLLKSSGTTLRIGRANLFVGGTDDFVQMHGRIDELLAPSINRAMEDVSRDSPPDFRLLLCHRPEGFGPATNAGFDLTLSGHTHGGQIGMFGKSLLEKIKPGIGWWGSYSKVRPSSVVSQAGGKSRLYTTSGFGHWFPFRVGCPTEMPLVVLEKEPNGPSELDRV
jgi:uncharacterized protein